MACKDIQGPSKTSRVVVAGLAAGAAIAMAIAIASIAPHQAHASPAFTAQTKLPCTQCHTGPPSAQGLTNLGKQFKDNGNKLPK